MTHFPSDEKKRLIVRLNRISGQINGLSKMINDDRECIEVESDSINSGCVKRGMETGSSRAFAALCY